jgi:hypothetical protein
VRSLHPSYRGLNSSDVPVTKFLFGYASWKQFQM